MAEIKIPIQVNLPDDWVDQVVNRLRNDTDAEWTVVVRCKDCKFLGEKSPFFKDYYDCQVMDKNIKLDDFCSYAERQEE